jgi:hypothetical protein
MEWSKPATPPTTTSSTDTRIEFTVCQEDRVRESTRSADRMTAELFALGRCVRPMAAPGARVPTSPALGSSAPRHRSQTPFHWRPRRAFAEGWRGSCGGRSVPTPQVAWCCPRGVERWRSGCEGAGRCRCARLGGLLRGSRLA